MKLKLTKRRERTDVFSCRLGTLVEPFVKKCKEEGFTQGDVVRTLIEAWINGEIEIE